MLKRAWTRYATEESISMLGLGGATIGFVGAGGYSAFKMGSAEKGSYRTFHGTDAFFTILFGTAGGALVGMFLPFAIAGTAICVPFYYAGKAMKNYEITKKKQ